MKLRNTIREKVGDRKLLTIGEAAEVLGMSLQAILNFLTDDALPCEKVDGRIYIKSDPLIAVSDTLIEVEEYRQKAIYLKEQISGTVKKRKKPLDLSRKANSLFGRLNDSKFSGYIVNHFLSMCKSVLSEREYTVLRYLIADSKDIKKIEADDTSFVLSISPNQIERIINEVRNKIHVAKDYATLEEENKKLKQHIDLLYEVYKKIPKDVQTAFAKNNPLPTQAGFNALDTLLEDYNVDARIINYLYPYGIRKISDLVQCSRERSIVFGT
jgi:hypothetical protein